MRTILLQSCFFLLAPFMMHGMDPVAPTTSQFKKKPNPSDSPPLILPLQPRQQRSKTNPDVSSPFIQSKTNPDESSHFTQSDSSSSTENPSIPRSRSTESAARGRSKQHPNDKPRKLLSSSPSKKSDPFSFENLKTAIQRNKLELLTQFLRNPANNPNIQNKHGNTLLHSSVFLRKKNAVTILVQDPRLNSLTHSTDNKPAYAYATEVFPDIYNILNQRATLDHIVYAFLVTNKMFFETSLNDAVVKAKIVNLLKRLPPKILPSYADDQFINSMVHHCLDYDQKRLKKDFLNFSKNHNYQGIHGDTLVHLLVYLRKPKKVAVLIKNPLISFILTNNDGRFPHGLLSSEENNIGDMSVKLFMRDSLERWVRTAVDNVPMDYPTEDTSNPSALTVQSTLIQKIIAQVKSLCVEIKKSQPTPDGKLPSIASNIPGYATDYFFLELIQDQFRKITLPSNQKIPFMITDTAASEALAEKEALQAIKLTAIKDKTKTDLEKVAAQYYLTLYQTFRANMLSQVATQIDTNAKDAKGNKIDLEENDRTKLIDKTIEELAIKAAQELFKKEQIPLGFPQ